MRPKVYVETTIVSYLAARPSRDLITAAHQQITQDWWENRRTDFDLYVSQLVVQEANASSAHLKSCWRGRTMWTDLIVEETRQARETHTAQFNYELEAIYRDLKAKEQESTRKVVSFPPKQPMAFIIQKGVEANAA